jgi:hypothetical protein
MDGSPHPTLARARALARLAALTVAATLALPVAGAGAAVEDPAGRWPTTGTAMHAAFAVAVDRWGAMPCGGHVDVRWEALAPGTNADARWHNPVSPWSRPLENAACEVALSPDAQWDWTKLCSVVVHEVGHLWGHDHAEDQRDVMFPIYLEPVAECAATPEPAEIPAPAAAAPAPRRATPARQAAPAGGSRQRGRRAVPKRTAKKRVTHRDTRRRTR